MRRGEVELVAHDEGWAAMFEVELESLTATAGHLLVRIEHVGSTSVPGLMAKPILDVAAAIRHHRDLAELSKLIAPLGWIDRGDKGPKGGYHLYVRESEPDVRTHHLHVVPAGSPGWMEYVFFRNALRKSEKLRAEYASEKRRLALLYASDRSSYTAAKEQFVRRVLASASAVEA